MTIEETSVSHLLGAATVRELEESLRGQLVQPHDEGYDEARAVWNGAHDRRPALIVRCAGLRMSCARSTSLASEDLLYRGARRRPLLRGVLDVRWRHRDRPVAHEWHARRSGEPHRAPRRAAAPGRTSTTRRRRSGWRPPAGSSRRRGSPA